MMKSRGAAVISLIIALVITLILSGAPGPAMGKSTQQSAANEPVLQQGSGKSYGAGEVLGTFPIDLPECWHRGPNYGATCDWWPCDIYASGMPATKTPCQTIGYVLPRVIRDNNDFTVPSPGALFLDVVLEKDVTHWSWLGYDVERYDDASGKWVVEPSYKVEVRIENGKVTRDDTTKFDWGQLMVDSRGLPSHPMLSTGIGFVTAGKYRLYVWSQIQSDRGEFHRGTDEAYLTGKVDAYMPGKGTFTVIFVPKSIPCPCINNDLCKDSDSDGVLDWEDLCPLQKASLDKFGKPAHNGCPDPATWLNALQADSENLMRDQIREFLLCQNIINADVVAQDLVFDYSGGDPEYNDGVIRIGGPMLQEYWRAEKEAKCTGKAPSIKQGETIYGLLYHEMGHYIADEAGVANVTGAGGIHDPWKESNPGKAFDEGRADLIMNLMGRYFNRETKEESGYGFAAYQSKIGSHNSNIVGDAVASTLIDILPSDPCAALNVFMDVQYVVNRPEQNIQDWLLGYNTYLYDKYRKDLYQYVQADTKLGETCKKYAIDLPVGSLYKCVNPNGVTGVEYDANNNIKSFIIDRNTPNIIGMEGEARIQVNWDPPLIVKPTHTDYEVKISTPGTVTVIAIEGSVTVTNPDNRQVVVQQGNTYTYPETSSGGKDTETDTGTGTVTGTGTRLTAESRTATPNSTIQVPIRLNNASNIGSMNFVVTYNPQVLRVNKVDSGSMLSGALFTPNYLSPPEVRCGLATSGGVSGSGTMVYIEFQVIGPAGSSSPLTISELSTGDASGQSITVNSQNGTVTVATSKLKGDYNGDGKLSEVDALAALRMSVKLLAQDLTLDMNGDGKLTAEDARLIIKKALGK